VVLRTTCRHVRDITPRWTGDFPDRADVKSRPPRCPAHFPITPSTPIQVPSTAQISLILPKDSKWSTLFPSPNLTTKFYLLSDLWRRPVQYRPSRAAAGVLLGSRRDFKGAWIMASLALQRRWMAARVVQAWVGGCWLPAGQPPRWRHHLRSPAALTSAFDARHGPAPRPSPRHHARGPRH